MKIALAHDSFTQQGGAERALEALHEMFPEAPIFTLVFNPKFRAIYSGWDIQTSSLQTLYLSLDRLQYLLPLIPWGVDSLDFSGFDLIISSSSGFIKNLRKPKNAVHLNYCHTPARFLWSDKNYVNQEVKWWLRPLAKIVIGRMRIWDYRGAQRVTRFIANSKVVQERIKKYYNRESDIVYPFADTDFWQSTKEKEEYFLLGGRLQAHKHNELIVEIFNELGLPLRIFGTGRQEKYLKSIAKSNITFLGRISDQRLRDEYGAALGFIYPQLEDFGLMPLEAAACGTATLAYGKGGSLETIVGGETGEFFESYDKEKIKRIILTWDPKKYKTDVLRSQAEKFSKGKFKKAIMEIVKSNITYV